MIASGIVDEHLPRLAEAYGGAGLAVVAHAVTRSWAAALLVRDA